jgi:putative addiction module component (TIGR02574 family)
VLTHVSHQAQSWLIYNVGQKASCSVTQSAYRSRIMSIAELRKLPADEKLRIIEALWGDVADDDKAFQSPAWHEAELRKTEADLAAGRIAMLDWDEAKKELRKRFE